MEARTYRLSAQQKAAVLKLDAAARYDHFVKRVTDWQTVWGLRDDTGWVSAAGDDGRRGLPFWPHPDYAAACAGQAWAGNVPAPIHIDEFVGRWLANMAEDSTWVSVFPTPGLQGVWVPAARLAADLRAALAQYE